MTSSHPPVAALFVDCDDCLYQNEWATAKKITASIAAYVASIGVSKDEAYTLYKKHGTCLKGLLAEGLLDESGAELIISWTNEQIDAALNAWQRGVRDTAKLEGEVVRNAWPTPEWMAEWKEKTVDLQEKVTNGARPSLIEIARSFM